MNPPAYKFKVMKILLNGRNYEYNASDKNTLPELLDRLKIESQRVAIMINARIISRENRASARVKEGDRVEIVTCAPGG